MNIDVSGITNWDSFSRVVALHEGKKKNMSIAQIKEVLKITRQIFMQLSPEIREKLVKVKKLKE